MRLTADVTATFTAEGAEAFTVDAGIEVGTGESLVVLGPSGSGKSLLLETLAGFHEHAGVVTVAGERVEDRPPEKREFGFVFQDYALFPHMTVLENVEYGARYHRETRDPDRLLSELGVASLTDRYPPTLSGGEKQRVALARALVVRPEVLLLDEPLAALDVPTRQSLRNDLADVLSDATTIYVTHNRTTARALADRIAVMRDGLIVQAGSAEDVFERPNSPMVAEFTGANAVALSDAPSLRGLLDAGDRAGGHVAIRPEAIAVDGAAGDLRATVDRVVREDAAYRVSLVVDDARLEAFTSTAPSVGDEVGVTVDREALHRC